MPPQCQALVIHCIDFRFISAIRDFLKSRGLKDQYDLVSLAGATKGLAEGKNDSSETILRAIGIGVRFHGIKDIYIIHHMDCLAYQNQYAFNWAEAERNRLKNDMETAKNVILKEYSHLQIIKVLAETNFNLNIIP